MMWFLTSWLLVASGIVYCQGPSQGYSEKAIAFNYFIENDQSSGVDGAYASYKNEKFTKSVNSILNLGISNRPAWMEFNVMNPENKENVFTVEIQNSRLNEIELFEDTGNKLISMGKLGDFFPFSQRKVGYKNFVYEVQFKPRERKCLFLRINQVGHTLECSIHVYTANKFRSASFNDYLRSGFTYGILFVVAIMSLVFFGSTKQSLYLYYSLYIFTAIFWFLAYFGIGYQYIWGQYPYLNTMLAPLMAAVNLILNIQICQILLKPSNGHRTVNIIAIIIKFLLFALAMVPLVVNLNDQGAWLNGTFLTLFLWAILLAMCFLIVVVLYFASIGLLAAKFYFWASILKAFSIIYLAGIELGFANGRLYIEESMQAGIFLEILLLTCALARQYTNFRAKTFIQVIKAHEDERLALSQELHDGLANSLAVIALSVKQMIDFGSNSPEVRRDLEATYKDIQQAHREARAAFYDTKPEDIQSKTLPELTKEYIDRVSNRLEKTPSKLLFPKINFSYNDQPTTLTNTVKLNAFRILQELITNIVKHSKATSADIIISFDRRKMILTAEDDGIGFNIKDASSAQGHGILNIESRAKMLNGQVKIKSKEVNKSTEVAEKPEADVLSHGTLICITIPLRKSLFNKRIENDY